MEILDCCDLCGENHATEVCPDLGLTASNIQLDQLSTRARLTLPSYLQLIDNGTGHIGVVAKETLPKKTQLGPYEAKRTTHIFEDTGFFTLKLIASDGTTVCLDTTDENECNWLCLVHTAINIQQQNCVAYQLGSNIFYNTTRDINVGEELRVWYSAAFARKLGKPVEPDPSYKVLLGHHIEPLNNEFVIDDTLPIALADTSQVEEIQVVRDEAPAVAASVEETGQEVKPSVGCPRCCRTFPTQSDMVLHLREHLYDNSQQERRGRGRPRKHPVVPKVPADQKRGKGRPRKVQPNQYNTDLHDDEELVVKKVVQTYARKRKHDETEEVSYEDIEDEYVADDTYGLNEVEVEWLTNEYSPKKEITVPPLQKRPSRANRGKHSKFNSDYVYAKIKLEPPSSETIVDNDKVDNETNDIPVGNSGVVKRGRGRPKKIHKANAGNTDNNKNKTKDTLTSTEINVCLEALSPAKNNSNATVKRYESNTANNGQNLVNENTDESLTEPKNKSEDAMNEKTGLYWVDNFHSDSDSIANNHSDSDSIANNESEANDETIKVGGSDGVVWTGELLIAEDMVEENVLDKSTNKSDNNKANTKDIGVAVENEQMLEAVEDKGDESVIEKGNENVIEKGDENVNEKGNESVIEKGNENVIGKGNENVTEKGNESVIENGNVIEKGDEAVNENENVIGKGSENVIEKGRKKEEISNSKNVAESEKSENLSGLEKLENEPGSAKFEIMFEKFENGQGTESVESDLEPERTESDSKSDKQGKLADAEKMGNVLESVNSENVIESEHSRNTIKGEIGHLEGKTVADDERNVKVELSNKESMVVMFEETSDGKYGCVLCEREFVEEIDAISHFMDHNQKDNGTCDRCDANFDNLNELLVHRKTCKKENDGQQAEQSDKGDGRGGTKEQRVCACAICHQTFKSTTYLYRHMVMHTDMYTCRTCKKTFSRKDSLQRHILKCCIELAKEYQIYYCEVCYQVFSKPGGLQRHKIKCRSVKCVDCNNSFATMEDRKAHKCKVDFDDDAARYACGQCSKKFQSMYYLTQHKKLHSNQHHCKRCGRNFTRSDDLFMHGLMCETLENIRIFGTGKCWWCSTNFTNSKSFRDHALSHSHPYKCEKCDKHFMKVGSFVNHECNTVVYVCNICKRKFKNEDTLQKHLKEKECLQYQCMGCEQHFHLKSQVYEHMKSCEQDCLETHGQVLQFRHNINEVCELCGKVFSSKSNLTKHKLLHGEKKHACPHCDKKFHLEVYLKEHITCVHYNMFKYQCNMCGRMMKSKTGLIAHERIFHNKEAAVVFTCPTCNKVFNQKGNLTSHMYSHSNERRFACDICHRTFKFPDQLSRHKHEHRNTAMFSCQECNKQFVRSNELSRHYQVEHSGHVYVCHICSARCCQRHTMVRHFKRKHPDKVELLLTENYVKSMWKHVSTLGDEEKSENPVVDLQNVEEVTETFLLTGPEISGNVGQVDENIIIPQDSFIVQDPNMPTQVVTSADQLLNVIPQPGETTVEMVNNEDGTISFNSVQSNSKGHIIILQIVDPEAATEQETETIQQLSEVQTLPEGVLVVNQVTGMEEGQVTVAGIETVEQDGEKSEVGGTEVIAENSTNVIECIQGIPGLKKAIITQIQGFLQSGEPLPRTTSLLEKNLTLPYKQVQTVLLQKDGGTMIENYQPTIDNQLSEQSIAIGEETGLQIMEETGDLQDDLKPIPECIASTETVHLSETIGNL